MTEQEAINQAVTILKNKTEPEMIPVSDGLRMIGHPYWDDFCFCFCVAHELGKCTPGGGKPNDQKTGTFATSAFPPVVGTAYK